MSSKICSVEGCNNKHKGLGYCNKHLLQYKRYGKILDRTHRDLNEIIEYEDYAEIIMYNKSNEEVGRTIIGLEDIDEIKNIKWHIDKNGYCYNKDFGLLHRYLTNPNDNMVVDHINGNKLDNRKSNLRICTQSENNKNAKKHKRNTSSQYKGVSKYNNRWRVGISVNNKRKHIGYFNDELDASIAYDKAAIMYFGIYCKTNHPIENYYDYIIELGLDPDDFIKDAD